MVVVKSNRPWAEILGWLQTNVGQLLWSQPIIMWHGQGWKMKHYARVMPRGKGAIPCYTVEFDDPKMATLFALWA